jgi:hypothetical protein
VETTTHHIALPQGVIALKLPPCIIRVDRVDSGAVRVVAGHRTTAQGDRQEAGCVIERCWIAGLDLWGAEKTSRRDRAGIILG